MISVSTDTSNHTTDVTFDDTKTDTEEMKSRLEAGGYPAESYHYVHTELTPEAAETMISDHPDMTVIDVREEKAFCSGYIVSAVNYPRTSGIFDEKYAELSPDADILIVSETGDGLSHSAAQFLDAQGFTSVYDMGETDLWKADTVTCCPGGLKEAVLILQIAVSLFPENTDNIGDADGDDRIGLYEAICILKKISG